MKILKNFILIILIISVLSIELKAADILGCPNGIPKGTIWPRLNFKTMKMSEKYDWNTGKMVDIEKLCGNAVIAKKLKEYDFRLGYGITSFTDIAIQIKYRDVETTKQKNITGAKKIHFNESDISELWLSFKYRFIDTEKTGFKNIDYFKLNVGAAYGFGLADDLEDVISGMGPGCDKAQLGLLMHGGFKSTFDFAGHIIYEWWGKSPKYAASELLPCDETINKNKFNFGNSNRNMPDRLQYMFVGEYPVSDYFELKAALSGWLGIQDTKGSVYSTAYKNKSFKAYSHNAVAAIQFYPMTEEFPKRKIMLQVSLPYKDKNTVTSDCITSVMAMWSF